MIQFNDLLPEIEEKINQTNATYNESFNKARRQAVNLVVEQFVQEHPNATKEEIMAYANDYLEQTPDEFLRTCRLFCNCFGALFNVNNMLLTEVSDFKNCFCAVNSQKIEAAARRFQKIQEAEKAAAPKTE